MVSRKVFKFSTDILFIIVNNILKEQLMVMIGQSLGCMHKADIIHSDLTTSNMMIHMSSAQPELVEPSILSFSSLSDGQAGTYRFWALFPVYTRRR